MKVIQKQTNDSPIRNIRTRIEKPKLSPARIQFIFGMLGLLFIQCSTFPTIINAISNPNASLPPLSMVVLVWTGLICYLVRAILIRDTIYIISNALGFFTQSILMAIILFPH